MEGIREIENSLLTNAIFLDKEPYICLIRDRCLGVGEITVKYEPLEKIVVVTIKINDLPDEIGVHKVATLNEATLAAAEHYRNWLSGCEQIKEKEHPIDECPF